MRYLLFCCLMTIASITSAFPVNYEFSGYVTGFLYNGTTFNPSIGDPIRGKVTYDATYKGSLYGQPLPIAPALLNWELSIDGESYYQQTINPLIETIACCGNNTINFFDEMPGNTSGAAFFDQGGFGFQFSHLGASVPPELSIKNFLGGWFSWGGGSGSGNSGASLNGVIDKLEVQVPEPTSISLAILGLIGIYLTSRNRPNRSLSVRKYYRSPKSDSFYAARNTFNTA